QVVVGEEPHAVSGEPGEHVGRVVGREVGADRLLECLVLGGVDLDRVSAVALVEDLDHTLHPGAWLRVAGVGGEVDRATILSERGELGGGEESGEGGNRDTERGASCGELS